MTKAQPFAEHASHHTDRRDLACHAIGNPFIVALAVLIYYAAIDLIAIRLGAVATITSKEFSIRVRR